MSLIVKDTHVWIIVACPGLNSLDTETFTGANQNQWVHHERRFNFNVDFVFWTFWKCVQTTFLWRKLWGFWKFSSSERDERRHFSLKAEERRHGTSLFHETLLAIRLVRELFHLISNCGSQWLSLPSFRNIVETEFVITVQTDNSHLT